MCATTVYGYRLAVNAPNGKGMITSLTNAIFFSRKLFKNEINGKFVRGSGRKLLSERKE